MTSEALAQALKDHARQLGFTLAGITTPDAPAHWDVYAAWVGAGRQAGMSYLADERALQRRADPKLILPECQSILVLGIPYFNPQAFPTPEGHGRVAAYAWGDDYHEVLPPRLQALVAFLEAQVGQPVANRWYTDTGPVLERELAARAGLGWVGKNSCLIAPGQGSYFLLAEIFLGLALPPDPPFAADHCGTCTRCISACPTQCILPNRTLDAGRCISYLTIENKGAIPLEVRPRLGDWVFGCDICQQVCPWNQRFATARGDPAFSPPAEGPHPKLEEALSLTAQAFNRKFKKSPIRRAKRRGYLRNVVVAMSNLGLRTTLAQLKDHDEALVRDHIP